jgi:hypothetical protein
VHPAARTAPEGLAVLARMGAVTPAHSILYPSTEIALELIGKCLAAP